MRRMERPTKHQRSAHNHTPQIRRPLPACISPPTRFHQHSTEKIRSATKLWQNLLTYHWQQGSRTPDPTPDNWQAFQTKLSNTFRAAQTPAFQPKTKEGHLHPQRRHSPYLLAPPTPQSRHIQTPSGIVITNSGSATTARPKPLKDWLRSTRWTYRQPEIGLTKPSKQMKHASSRHAS